MDNNKVQRRKQSGGSPVAVLLTYAGVGAVLATVLGMAGGMIVIGNNGTKENVSVEQQGGGWVRDKNDLYTYKFGKGDKGNDYIVVYKNQDNE